jgi:3-oxoacyl-[acyl-carrier protein] reductase
MNNGVLAGKTAVITGASRGIGAAIALCFAEAGAQLVLAARSRDDLRVIADRIKAQGGTAHTVPTDMGDLDQVKALACRARELTGGIDILVSNAAISGPTTPVLSTDPAEWDRVYRVNFLGPLTLIQTLGPQLIGRPGANIVIVSSLRGMGGTPFNEPYSSSKAALNHLVKTLACELGPQGVRVNAVIPGPVDTDMTAGFFEGREQLKTYYGNLAPLKGWTQAEDCAGPALFLASDAARRVTGHLLSVDGGLFAINQDAFGPPESML